MVPVIVAVIVVVGAAGGFWLWKRSSKSKKPGLRPGRKKSKSTKLTKGGRALIEAASKGDTEGVRDALKKTPVDTTGSDFKRDRPKP